MPLKILITDDHDEFRAMVRSWLESMKENFVVYEASSGELGIIKALREKPDLVLMDIRLPEMNGLQAAQQIKQKIPGCKVVILTMFETESFRQVFQSADIDAYLGKSEVFEVLLPTLVKLKLIKKE